MAAEVGREPFALVGREYVTRVRAALPGRSPRAEDLALFVLLLLALLTAMASASSTPSSRIDATVLWISSRAD